MAQSEVQKAEGSGKVHLRSSCQSRHNLLLNLMEVASLVFLAEWGDRSMIATVAFATASAHSPCGVCISAAAGHAASMATAVMCGVLAGQHVNERTVNAASGILFLLFAVSAVL